MRHEFLSTRLVETGPSTLKLQNPPGSHDDIVTAVGMVVADLAERPDYAGTGMITVPGMVRVSAHPPNSAQRRRVERGGGSGVPDAHDLRRAARNGPRLPGGAIMVPGSGNDPRRIRRQ